MRNSTPNILELGSREHMTRQGLHGQLCLMKNLIACGIALILCMLIERAWPALSPAAQLIERQMLVIHGPATIALCFQCCACTCRRRQCPWNSEQCVASLKKRRFCLSVATVAAAAAV